MKRPSLAEARRALDELDADARILETHDLGPTGAARIREAVALLRRRLLWGAFCVALAAACAGCSRTPSSSATRGTDLVAHPGVSAPVIERTRLSMKQEVPTPRATAPIAKARRARAPMALLAAAPAPFDCQRYAASLLPWSGPSFTDPRFIAVGEAMLPDAPEFAARRAAGCAVLQAAAGGAQ